MEAVPSEVIVSRPDDERPRRRTRRLRRPERATDDKSVRVRENARRAPHQRARVVEENERGKPTKGNRRTRPKVATNPASEDAPPSVEELESLGMSFPKKHALARLQETSASSSDDEPSELFVDRPHSAEALDSMPPMPVPSGRMRELVRRIDAGLRWLFRWTVRVVVTIGIGAGVYFGGIELHRFVRTADAFAIREIQVEGRERLERDEILRAAGIDLGTNVFERDPEEVRARLLAHPWVAEAEVTRQLPGAYSIGVVEHHPVALLEFAPLEGAETDRTGMDTEDRPVAEDVFLIADDARLFKVYEEGSDPGDLPRVSGVDRARFVSDRGYRRALLAEVVALFDAWRAAGLWRREPPQRVEVSSDRRYTALAGEEEPIRLALGFAPHRQKLRRLRRLLDRVGEMELRPEYVLLDNVRRPDRVTVRFHEVPMPDAPEEPSAER